MAPGGVSNIGHTPHPPPPAGTYVIKLFDRSVELGQFSPGAPLYPVCRAWMRNRPTPPTPPLAPPRDGAAATPPGQTPPGTPRGEVRAGVGEDGGGNMGRGGHCGVGDGRAVLGGWGDGEGWGRMSPPYLGGTRGGGE